MFGYKRMLKEIEKEKEELLFIKQHLEDVSPKVDISNVYIWEEKGIFSIVKLNIKKMRGIGIFGREVDGYNSILTDVFTNNVVYQKNSLEKIGAKEFIFLPDGDHYGYCRPIVEVEKNLLAYADKKVPLYVLQQLYYRLNCVDVNSSVLMKKRNKEQ